MVGEYYYIIDTTKTFVATSIARGGSKAACISEIGKVNDRSCKPYLFNSLQDVLTTLAKGLSSDTLLKQTGLSDIEWEFCKVILNIGASNE